MTKRTPKPITKRPTPQKPANKPTVEYGFTELAAQVAASGTVVDSVIILINGIADRSETSLLALELKAKAHELAKAVEANTPGAPPPA